MSPPTSRSNQSHQDSVAVLASELLALKERVTEDRELATRTFVTKDTFGPVQKLVYGMTGLALAAVVTGILALVIHKGGL